MAQPVIRIRGHMKPAGLAKLLKGGREPSLAEIVKLMKDTYGESWMELEVEVHLKPEVNMKPKERD
jgi:hypothetical protein